MLPRLAPPPRSRQSFEPGIVPAKKAREGAWRGRVVERARKTRPRPASACARVCEEKQSNTLSPHPAVRGCTQFPVSFTAPGAPSRTMRPLSSQRPHLVASSSTASAAPHRRSLPRTAATPARPPPPPPRRTGRRPPTTQLLTEELARDLPGPDDEPLDELVEAETIAVRRGEGNSATPSLAHTCSPDPKTLSFPRLFFF